MENRQWQKDKMEARIINGRPVKFSIPWMVKLDIKKGGRSAKCTGFIVTAWHIMVKFPQIDDLGKCPFTQLYIYI